MIRAAILLVLVAWGTELNVHAQGDADQQSPPRPAKPGRRGSEIEQAFARSTTESGETDLRTLERELGRLKPTPVSALFSILNGRTLLVPRSDEVPVPHPLTDAEASVVARVLAKAPGQALRRHLEIVATTRGSREARELALWFLGVLGTPADLDLLARLAASEPGARTMPRSTRKAFEDALIRIVDRHHAGLWSLTGFFSSVPGALKPAIVRAIEGADDDDSLRILGRLLGKDPALDAVVLTAIARRAQRASLPLDEGIRYQVRSYLSRGEEDLVLLALVAVGKLEDYEAVPILMRVIETGDGNRRQRAFDALRSITRSSMRSDPEVWGRWYGAEMRWWDEEADRTIADLGARDRRRVVHAINELSQHKLNRHELSAALLACLGHQDSGVVVLACDALAQFGSALAVPELIARLDRAEVPEIRKAAWKALQAITGLELPPDRDRWREACK